MGGVGAFLDEYFDDLDGGNHFTMVIDQVLAFIVHVTNT